MRLLGVGLSGAAAGIVDLAIFGFDDAALFVLAVASGLLASALVSILVARGSNYLVAGSSGVAGGAALGSLYGLVVNGGFADGWTDPFVWLGLFGLVTAVVATTVSLVVHAVCAPRPE